MLLGGLVPGLLAQPAAARPDGVARPAASAASAASARLAASARPAALQPLAGEWWFSSWDIQTRVWPVTRGRGVTVALLDSGVQARVPDLRGAVVAGGDTTGAGTNGETDDNLSEDGHGTAMAALIAGQGRGAAAVVGIAPAAKIMPVRVGGLHGVQDGGTPASLAAGIRFAVARGAEVINMSLSNNVASVTACDPVLQSAIGYALEHNVVVVASSGNQGASGSPPVEPAVCAGVLAVGAVNPDLTLWPGSNQGPYVTVTAPGTHIPWVGRNGQLYPSGYGTSQAAAFVSGEAALIRSRYPRMPWPRVVQRITGTALRRGSPVPNDKFGYGIVRISNALNLRQFKVPAGAPNPVYQAYASWRQSQPAPRPSGSRPAAGASPAAAPAGPASGLSAGVIAGLAAAVVLAAAAVAVVLVRRRRAGP